ncbi:MULTISPECIES: PadR family transcriptional regulator [Subtercola]|uniref:PadR family transcriptional regulator n=1 Tax=Subtercola vilae TaxID=2056433 RepID=A0A4T2BUU6_9MICO|nr:MULTISPECIES: PadR family transcriptional regulator [Subtercola]MEA9985515.1 PadR family transcriptional regulator [Subtercola sp. RTI3]TIH35160.1 PadR family transcriptional regulator [Subtercola vilae]
MNPVFGHGHLRLYILNLLSEHPFHGYELMQSLSERFGGTYSPSAGTIYPRLSKLEEEGLVTKSSDGRKTTYVITDAGRAELAARRAELDSIEDSVTDSVRLLADGVRAGVTAAMKSLRADLASAARDSADPRSGHTTGNTESTEGQTDTSSGEEAAPAATGTPAAAPTAEQRRSASGDAVREAEVALTAFRSAVRTDLRTHAATGSVSAEAVRAFTEDLRHARATLRSNLGG